MLELQTHNLLLHNAGRVWGDTEKVDMSHVIDKQMLKKGGHRRNAHAAVNSKPQVSCLKKLLTTARCAEYHLASYGLDRS